MRLGRAGDSLTSLVPVAVAATLIAFCLAGAPLYSSSSGSASLDDQLAETCRTWSALALPIPPDQGGDRQRSADIVDDLSADIPYVEPPRQLAMARPFRVTESALPQRLRLLWIEGVDVAATPGLTPLGRNEIALTDANLEELHTEIGGVVNIDGARLTVTQRFDDVPFNPVPDFWCGFPELFLPTPAGDRPPPFAIASRETIEAISGNVVWNEYRVIDEPLTMTEIAETQRGYEAAEAEWARRFPFATEQLGMNELERIIERATAVRVTVDRNLAPVALTGVTAGAIVLIAASVLVARDRQRQLRLMAVRGVPPWRVAWWVAPQLGGTVLLGTITGLLLAWASITLFGPSSNLEPSAIARAVAWVVLATLGAALVVCTVVALVGDGYADQRRRRFSGRWVALAVVLGVVALAAVAFRRLDQHGGVRTFGVESRGGDLLAMGFPLFCLLAIASIAGFLLAVLTPRLRLTGARLTRSIRLGWRRVVLDTGPLVAVIVAAALAAGCFTVASALANGAERQLADKSVVYVGADLSVSVFGDVSFPPDWTAPTTVTANVDVKRGAERGELMGIDPDTFGDVATLRADGADRSLTELTETVAAPPVNGVLPAIAVGVPDAEVGDVLTLELPGRTRTADVEVVSVAEFFPAKSSNIEMYVVDRSALQEVTEFTTTALLVADPPTDAVQQLRNAGTRVGTVLDVNRSFDGSAYSALRWAYAPLATLGAWFAIVALALQLLVVSARRTQRRIADAVMRRTGFTRSGLWRASVIEAGVPLLVGSLIGIGAAVLAGSLSVVRLDPMPMLAPPAQFSVPWNVIVGTLCVVPIWTAVIATLIVRSTVKVDPMRVFQGSA